jgi:lipopolysaccharide/colanic/teichoic acid biosynthesis glycosyltransferase
MMKRTLDTVFAVVGLVLLSPVIVLAVVIATIDTRAGGLFGQPRVGRHGRPITVRKVRTMRPGGSASPVTIARDPRLTVTGAIMRRYRIDELPQLWNVIRGDMSLVGPRPDVAGFADRLKGTDRSILEMRPGITGPASLVFRGEDALLAEQSDPESFNRRVIWPLKVRINRAYQRSATFADDLRLIAMTIRPNSVQLEAMLARWDRSLPADVRRVTKPATPDAGRSVTPPNHR